MEAVQRILAIAERERRKRAVREAPNQAHYNRCSGADHTGDGGSQSRSEIPDRSNLPGG
jgi:hypothetical protein